MPESSTIAVLRLAQPKFRRFAPGVFFGVLSALSSVALLATSAWLITRAAEHPPILFLSAAIVGVRAFALLRASARYVERLLSHDAAFRQLSDLRVGIYRRLVPLAPDGLRDAGRGDLATRLVSDVDELQNLPLRVVQPLVVALITAVISVIGVSIILPAAGVALAIGLTIGFGVGTAVQSAVAGRAERSIAPLCGVLADRLLEFVTNLDVFVAFDQVPDRIAGIETADRRLRAATLSRAGGAGATTAILSALAALSAVAALLIGIPLLAHGSLNAPTLTVIALVPLAMFEVIGTAPLALGAWRQVRSSARRVAEVVPATVPAAIPTDRAAAGETADAAADAVADAAEAIGGANVPDRTAWAEAGSPALEIRGLSARWPGEASDGVATLDLTLHHGDRVVIEGPSGAGKTTLAHVLVRFLDYSGSYRLGGVEARDLSTDSVRDIVGLCEQSPYLFDEDIRQNLLFARDTATDDDLTAVLGRVGLADWAQERGGLSARVGDGGSLISGGQAQRLALARALLADFPVIVFDEPTANVDPELAAGLMRDILAVATDDRRTVVVISHTAVPDALVTQRLRLPMANPNPLVVPPQPD